MDRSVIMVYILITYIYHLDSNQMFVFKSPQLDL